MNASEQFKTAIENYLNASALTDTALAQNLAKPAKTLESCFNYIYGEVRKTGLCAFDNQEIFDMALKYYNDDSISTPAPINCRAVVADKPLQADLFTTAAEVEPKAIKPETIAKQAQKTAPQTLTLFD